MSAEVTCSTVAKPLSLRMSILGRFKSTFFPFFDINAYNQKPKHKNNFPNKRNQTNCYIEVGKKKEYNRIYQIAKT